MSFRKLTKQQRECYRALRELGGEMVVTPDVARQLRALARRGLVRYSRAYGARVAILRVSRAVTARRTRRMKATDSMYAALVDGHYIPPIEGNV